jgi:hypothetical protein
MEREELRYTLREVRAIKKKAYADGLRMGYSEGIKKGYEKCRNDQDCKTPKPIKRLP